MRGAKGRVLSLFAAALVCAPAAWAQSKVDVSADVVLASNNGSTSDPPGLAKMKDQFMKSGLAFTSFKRLKSARLSLEQGKPASLELPNKQTATFNLASVKDGTARVEVKLAKLNPTVALGREGSVFIQAGDYEGGKLVLVLSSGAGAQPRRFSSASAERPSALVCPRAEASVPASF